MGELFQRYFQLLAGRLPGSEYGVIATPTDEDPAVVKGEPPHRECLCRR